MEAPIVRDVFKTTLVIFGLQPMEVDYIKLIKDKGKAIIGTSQVMRIQLQVMRCIGFLKIGIKTSGLVLLGTVLVFWTINQTISNSIIVILKGRIDQGC